MNNPSEIKKLLRRSKTIAVVGLSIKTYKASNAVASYLQVRGYRIIPVNPNYSKILGNISYASLMEIPNSSGIDLVNVFRRSESVMPIVNQVIELGIKAVWLQEGVINEVAAKKAENMGITVVMDRCLLKEHRNYLP